MGLVDGCGGGCGAASAVGGCGAAAAGCGSDGLQAMGPAALGMGGQAGPWP